LKRGTNRGDASAHLLDADLYDFKNFAPLLKQARPLHGSVEKELDAVFDHSEENLGGAVVSEESKESILSL
jgi:hypothetical protein